MLRTLLAFMLALLCACRDVDPEYAMAALPPALQAASVDWGYGEVHGFGPGGNETGFYAIRLDEKGAGAAAAGGVTWLNAQVGGRIRPDWSETPVPRDEFWIGRADSAIGLYAEPTVWAALEKHGFGIDLPENHRSAADAAINKPGSFYAFGPGGLVAVIVPETRMAYVFHAG